VSKTVLITGASSGIGRQLALEFARRGYNLGLMARRESVLEELAGEVRREAGDIRVAIRPLDVQQANEVAPALQALDTELGGADCIIANAGIAGGGKAGSGHFDEDQAIIRTNVIGAMATIDAALAMFRQRGQGQIVAVASVAACRGLPGAGAYCASKAALSTYMESVEAEVYGSEIKTTTLFPGFIDTPLNDMMDNRPFLVSVEKGGRIMAELIEKQVRRSTVPPYPWGLVGRLLRLAPTRLLAGKSAL